MRKQKAKQDVPAAGDVPSKRGQLLQISSDALDATFRNVGEKLRNGLSGEAEALLWKTLNRYDLAPDDHAHLKRLLSFTLETAGRYKESLEVIVSYADRAELAGLRIDTQVAMMTRLAIAFNNSGEQPRAATLLKKTRQLAEEHDLRRLYGNIEIALARVYRKLAEYPICRDHGQAALEHFREHGDWLGMAEAYREIANSHNQEGNSAQAVGYFKLGIQIIGENSAPFMLGKLYTEMSGAYWFLRKPYDGVECLERSIEFFDQTEHALNSVIAYNNLGINLMLIGDWTKADAMIKRAFEIANQENYTHLAGIYDSMGELSILRGYLDEAEKLLEIAVKTAEEHKNPWYRLQSLRNLARCALERGDLKRAIAGSRETISLAKEVGGKHYENLAGLILAEAELENGDASQCIASLETIEASDPSSDFYVLGSIQRIRGLATMAEGDVELSIHHFSRALTIFEASHDVYHAGLVHLLLGETDRRDMKRAKKHLATAFEIFKKLGRNDLAENAEAASNKLATKPDGTAAPEKRRSNSVVSQLLTVRLAEATASRELLFRELVAVLQQESNAQKLIIAQYNDQKRLLPFITHGYSAQESNALAIKLGEAVAASDEKTFCRTKNVALFPLRGTAAEPAFLVISPRTGAELNDGSSLQPLLRVVELGMDVVALREKDRARPAESEISAYQSNSLMPGFIHSSPAMTSLVEEVYKIRSSDVTVLVTGESGTGKELVSRAIHTLSDRKDKVFVPFNCTAVPKELAEGLLFGYRKGAFTGAAQDSPGVIRTADGGTLFLDEVGDLPIDVQPKLLRFLQEGEIQPLGEKQPLKVDVRIIAATNMPLEEKVADGTFREDLYYRLNVIRLRVPPLRERRSEIPPIVNYYINHYSQRFNKHDISFMPQTVDILMVCNWEGNVRQLCNEIQRIVARAEDGEVISPDHISAELRRDSKPLTPFDVGSNVRPIASFDGMIAPFANIAPGGTLEEAVTELEMQLIKTSLVRNNWNISRVAGELGLTRRGLYLKLARYGIEKAA